MKFCMWLPRRQAPSEPRVCAALMSRDAGEDGARLGEHVSAKLSATSSVGELLFDGRADASKESLPIEPASPFDFAWLKIGVEESKLLGLHQYSPGLSGDYIASI